MTDRDKCYCGDCPGDDGGDEEQGYGLSPTGLGLTKPEIEEWWWHETQLANKENGGT